MRRAREDDEENNLQSKRLRKLSTNKVGWSNAEIERLCAAVEKHGRDWESVAGMVGTRTNQQCRNKVRDEVKAGRMEEPEGKLEYDTWLDDEVDRLREAVGNHGRDWGAVAGMVGTRTTRQWQRKEDFEVKKGRMKEPGGKQEHDAWHHDEVDRLYIAVEKHGTDWTLISNMVATKTAVQCQGKVHQEVKAGRMKEPERSGWQNEEIDRLYEAVGKHGRDWKSVASMVGTKTNEQCRIKVQTEVNAGRMKQPEGN